MLKVNLLIMMKNITVIIMTSNKDLSLWNIFHSYGIFGNSTYWFVERKILKVLRTASKHVYYLGWNRSPAQVGCMRQALGPGALGRPRGIGRRGRWEGGSGWGTHVNPWLIHVNVWKKKNTTILLSN